MIVDINGVAVDFGNEKFIAALREQVDDRQIKRAFLSLRGKYDEKKLIDPSYVEGCWEGIKHAQADGGAIANAREKRMTRIENSYKNS
ncbi:hypothetical protein [Tolypothrix sp. VBCCA 56010]|uniref:hypothetical protein n=1 Tax=Tolypothrix sp. VBCCA 56010 TaxID=3137731 RepID=UPI003D7E282A